MSHRTTGMSSRSQLAHSRIERLEPRQLLSVVTYDLKSQWSDAKNPNGVWAYREGNNALPHVAGWQRVLGGFNPLQPGWARSEDGINRLPFWFKSSATPNFTHDWQTGDVIVHTTDNGNGVGNGTANVIWTSPSAGTISITGGVWMGRDIGRADHWSILKNSTALTEGGIASGDAFSRAKPFAFTAGSKGSGAITNLTVAKGDVIQLRVNVNKVGDGGDFVGVNLTVAETVGLNDGGFESPTLASGALQQFATGSTIGNAWTLLGTAGNQNAVTLVQTKYGEPANNLPAFTAEEGSNSLDLTGPSNQGTASGVKQAIATISGQQYQLSFFVGRASGSSVYNTASTVKLSINGGAQTAFTNSDSTANKINWKKFTTTFKATSNITTLSFFNGQTTNYFAGLDNVTVTPVSNGTLSGTVFNDINGNGTRDSGDDGVANVTVFVDVDHSGTLTTGDLSGLTNTSGAYTITGVPLGAASVLELLPSGFRASTTRPVAITIGGGTSTANFGITQTAVISGSVFNDANGDKIKNGADTALAGVVVYLDLNNNGVLDFLDLKTTTDSAGNFKFVVPFGTYTIRETAPSGFVHTSAVKTLTVAKGATSTGNNIANGHS